MLITFQGAWKAVPVLPCTSMQGYELPQYTALQETFPPLFNMIEVPISTTKWTKFVARTQHPKPVTTVRGISRSYSCRRDLWGLASWKFRYLSSFYLGFMSLPNVASADLVLLQGTLPLGLAIHLPVKKWAKTRSFEGIWRLWHLQGLDLGLQTGLILTVFWLGQQNIMIPLQTNTSILLKPNIQIPQSSYTCHVTTIHLFPAL